LKLSFAVGALTVPINIPGYYEWFNAIRGQWAALTVSIFIKIKNHSLVTSLLNCK
jgi:hypothetical protein